MVSNAWSNIKNTKLKRVWRKLLMHEIEEISEERTVGTNIEEAVSTLLRIPGYDCESDDVMQWFQVDKDNGSDKDNINFTQIEATDESSDEDLPSHVEAFKSFEKRL